MGNHIILVKIKELVFQHTQPCNDSQMDSGVAEEMDQLNIEVEAIMPLIQKYKEIGRSQSPNLRLWDDFLLRVMLLFKTLITANHI